MYSFVCAGVDKLLGKWERVAQPFPPPVIGATFVAKIALGLWTCLETMGLFVHLYRPL